MNLYDIAALQSIEHYHLETEIRARLARMDERALCFDPDPEYRSEIKRRMTEPRKEAA